jgi:hypothetical protein
MAFESTAINELVAGIQQKPLERDSSDWLFGEGDEATEIDPRGAEVRLFEPDPRAVSLPRPYVEMPAYALEHAYHRARSATTHVHAIDWSGIAKKLALPIAVVSIVSVALAVYFAKADEAPAKASPVVASESAAASVEDVKLEVTAEAVAVPAEPTTAAEPAKPVDVAPVTEAAPPVEPAPVGNVAAPVATATAPVATATAPVATAGTPEAAPAAEAVKVEPGSPASRFLAPPRVETTIRAAVKPAPAPTAVAGLVSPAAATSAPAAQPAAEPVAKIAATRVAKKSARQLRAEKRAAAKRAKRVAKVRAKNRTKRVAAATDDDARSTGKGILSIASTPSMQVWVDGRNSKAMTPVRIKLLAGTHKVTLLDNGRGKSRSFSVVIKPDETVKITKNYE